MKQFVSLFLSVLLLSSNVSAQVEPDPALLAEINRIEAIDNHAHPPALASAGEPDPEEAYFSSTEAFDVPARLRPDNPIYIAAWRALYGYSHDDMSEAHTRELMETKRRVRRERGEQFPAWVLDRAGVDVMLSNRVMMGRGLTSPRFLWVPFADPLMFPLDNAKAGAVNPDYRSRFEASDRMLKLYMRDLRIANLPPTLKGYLSEVVAPTLERWKRAGAPAVKFAAAYQRSLDFADAPETAASRVYARHVKGGTPPARDYKALQDFLFRHIAREAGRIGLVLHVHVGAGASGYFDPDGASPFRLLPVLNDPALRSTKFVLIHGGAPFSQQTKFLIYKPNVYADFSAQTFLLSPRELSETLRSWLEFVPEKVLFGSDAFELTPLVSWEEHLWLTTNSARRALALALTGMMNDGEITRERASEIARMVLRENAAKLYGLSLE